MGKITRSRTGCFTCKQRRRKCDETKPECLNCVNSGRKCAGYGIRLIFDVDDSRNSENRDKMNSKGEKKYGFRGRPRLKDSIEKNNTFVFENLSTVDMDSSNENDNNMNNIKKEKYIETAIRKENTDLKTEDSNSFQNSLGLDFILNPSLASNSVPSVAATSKNLQQEEVTPMLEKSDHSEIDFTDPTQFENALYSGLDYIFGNFDNQLDPQENADVININDNSLNNINLSPLLNRSSTSPILVPIPSVNTSVPLVVSPPTLDPISEFTQGSSQLNSSSEEDASTAPVPELKRKEENFILKHFFEKVIYLLDAHPQAPWPELMMRFGSFELAKSCFLSLSSMHLYVNNGENEFYKKGLLHINNTMEYLIKYVKNKDPLSKSNGVISVERVIKKMKTESKQLKGTNFIVILLLLYVHLLFAILESGRSALSRMFLKLCASIASDITFKPVLQKIGQSQTLICVLSWFDTISSLVSPDCRLPYCDPISYGTMYDQISTAKMNACPGEIFKIFAEMCILRNSWYNNNLILLSTLLPINEVKNLNLNSKKKLQINKAKISLLAIKELQKKLLEYRKYVPLKLSFAMNFSYTYRLKSAQCWSLAGLLLLDQLNRVYSISAYDEKMKTEERETEIAKEEEEEEGEGEGEGGEEEEEKEEDGDDNEGEDEKEDEDKDGEQGEGEYERGETGVEFFPRHLYSDEGEAIVLEFLSVYETLPSDSPIITQMVWPIFYVAVCSKGDDTRKKVWKYLEILYETVRMGTIKSIMEIVERIWLTNESLDSILNGEGWFQAGIDFLPC